MSQNNTNYILTENYFDDNNNQYFLINENTVVDLDGKTYLRIIAKYYCSNYNNEIIELFYNCNTSNYMSLDYKEYQKNGNIMQAVSDSSQRLQIEHFNYGIMKIANVIYENNSYKIEGLSSIFTYNATASELISNDESYQVIEKEDGIPKKVGILIIFQDNNLYPYEDKKIHEAIQYVQKNSRRLDDSIEMSLITDNNDNDYLTLRQNQWNDSNQTDNKLYKQYSYYYIINIANILNQNIENKGNIKNYHLIISPIDMYIKQNTTQNTVNKIAYTKNKSNESDYYYLTTTKLPKTKVFSTPTSYYLKNNNEYIQNLEEQDYKLDYYTINKEKISNFYILEIDYPDNIDQEKMPEINNLTYYQSDQNYICLNDLPDNDIRKVLTSIEGNLDIPLKDDSIVSTPYILINENYSNIETTFNNVYMQETQTHQNAPQTVYNRTIYNSCNIRASQIETIDHNTVNVIFASDAKPTEDIRINILLLKDRQLSYSIGRV